MIQTVFLCTCFFVIGLAAAIHVNRMNRRTWTESAGFALVAAGAFGSIAELMWGHLRALFGIGLMPTGYISGYLFILGVAIIAAKIGRADITRMICDVPSRLNQDLVRAASVAETRDDLMSLRTAACALLTHEGEKRQGVSECTPRRPASFIEQRFRNVQ